MLEAQTQPLFIPLKGLILGAALLAIPALVPAQAAQAQSNDSVASAKPATFLGTVQTMSGRSEYSGRMRGILRRAIPLE